MDFLLLMFKLFHIHPRVIFLLCENNVQVCAFHVECSVTRDLPVDLLLLIFNFSTCYSCCVEIMCKHVYFKWNVMSHGI